MDSLSGEKVLVTGGSGSIGSHLVEQILSSEPDVVRVFDNDEQALFDLQNEFEDNRLRFLLGDVRDVDRLGMAIEDIDVVFHAAALKHVGISEYNPFEAVRTNVQGTQNLIQVALEENVDSFVAISTDKASNPVSVMGATKLLSERLVVAANAYKGNRDTQFGAVRFGNVLGSNGSVVPIFFEQLRNGGPVTVTDPTMTRFSMPIAEAANLVIRAHERMTSGEIFVFKMPAFEVGTLAETVVEEYAPEMGYDPSEIDIEIIGPRPGERVNEKLISRDESHHARELDDMFAILPQIDIPGYEESNYTDEAEIDGEYTSADADLLTRAELKSLIDETVDAL